MMVGFRHSWNIIKTAVGKYFSDNGLFLASGLAFDLLLYCIPLALLIVSVLGYILAGSDQSLAQIEFTFNQLLPTSIQFLTKDISTIVANRGLLGLAGFTLFFLFSSAVFGSVRLVLNTVFSVNRPRGFLRGKVTDFFVMGFASLLFFLTMGLSSLLTFMRSLSHRFTELEIALVRWWEFVGDFLGFSFTVTLFFVLYRFSPTQTLSHRALWVGALTGAILFECSKWGFSWYVQLAQANVTLYGALSGLIFFFFWLYYACSVFIFGAVFGQVYDQESRKKIVNDSAQPV